MSCFELTPHVGIGPVHFGTHREILRVEMAKLGFGLVREKKRQDTFANGMLQVEYTDETISFIGVNSYTQHSLLYKGLDLFDVPAESSFALIASHDFSGEHTFSSYGYCFPNQVVTFYEADTQYDYKRAETREVWGQIGCGDSRYLNTILRIRGGVLNPPVNKPQ